MPVRELARKQPPAIPTQRALLVHRDGREQLIIQSALDAQGQSFGWIIPLPAAPTEFKVASPGLLTMLDDMTQPDITHDRGGELMGAYVVAAVCALIALMAFMSRGQRWDLILVLFVIMLLGGLLLPSLGTAPRPARTTSGVRVRETARVGSYDLAVLDATDAEALDRWLHGNGFATTGKKGTAIVNDYIRDGWTFVAAKLRRDESGLSLPHPLSMTCPATRPIYPMRLTALSEAPVALELYVLADRQASAGGLRLEYCQQYRGPVWRWRPWDGGTEGRRRIFYFRGPEHFRRIAHPALVALMWDRCVLTKLSAELAPEAMNADFLLSMSEAMPYRPHVYSARGAWETGMLYVIPCWSILLLMLIVAKRERIRARGGAWFAFTRLIVPPSCVAVLAVWLVYATIPKVPVSPAYPRWWQPWHSARAAAFDLAHETHDFKGMAIEEIRPALAARFRAAQKRGPFQLGPIREEDSPGNYTILEDERGVVLSFYAHDGAPIEMILREPR